MSVKETRRFPRNPWGLNSTTAISVLAALLILSIGCQKTEPRKQSSPAELTEQASNVVSAIEETSQELARLESELSTARSDHQEALEFQYRSRKRRLFKDVTSLVENIPQLDNIGWDTEASRSIAEALLIQDLESAGDVLDNLETSIAQLREARRRSDLPDRPDLDLRLASQHSEINLSYRQLSETIALLEVLGMEVQTRISPRLPALLWRHAEVLAGKVELHSEHAREIRTRLAEAPDAPELKALSDESEVAFSRDILNLESLVELMDRQELDTQNWRTHRLTEGSTGNGRTAPADNVLNCSSPGVPASPPKDTVSIAATTNGT